MWMSSLQDVIVFGMCAAGTLGFGYQCFDSIRSALFGIQPSASAPDANPRSPKTRLAGLTWGVTAGWLAFIAAQVALVGRIIWLPFF